VLRGSPVTKALDQRNEQIPGIGEDSRTENVCPSPRRAMLNVRSAVVILRPIRSRPTVLDPADTAALTGNIVKADPPLVGDSRSREVDFDHPMNAELSHLTGTDSRDISLKGGVSKSSSKRRRRWPSLMADLAMVVAIAKRASGRVSSAAGEMNRQLCEEAGRQINRAAKPLTREVI
jgi:hypothetical protein